MLMEATWSSVRLKNSFFLRIATAQHFVLSTENDLFSMENCAMDGFDERTLFMSTNDQFFHWKNVSVEARFLQKYEKAHPVTRALEAINTNFLLENIHVTKMYGIDGGAIILRNSSGLIANSTFTRNYAWKGGVLSS